MEDPREKLVCKVQEVFLGQWGVQGREVPGVSWGRLALLVLQGSLEHLEGEECQDLMDPWDRKERMEAGA